MTLRLTNRMVGHAAEHRPDQDRGESGLARSNKSDGLDDILEAISVDTHARRTAVEESNRRISINPFEDHEDWLSKPPERCTSPSLVRHQDVMPPPHGLGGANGIRGDEDSGDALLRSHETRQPRRDEAVPVQNCDADPSQHPSQSSAEPPPGHRTVLSTRRARPDGSILPKISDHLVNGSA